MMSLTDQLLRVSDVYAAAVGLSRARISTIVLNRGATLDAISRGVADVTTNTFEKAMLWFSVNWPAGAVWPEGIDRPQLQAAAAIDDDNPASGAGTSSHGPPEAGAQPADPVIAADGCAPAPVREAAE